ncbi:ribokinase [uncultured Brevibacillus sp.]|uniref:ribokinase n=1 Tax=uncultured Brevibacillus sp. TaxID=169970 RepID=UPI002592FAD2|nr:ribokinase [uncultured Brevibacillus sp.]
MKPNIVVIGSMNMDMVVQAPRLPVKGETLLGKSLQFVPGGKGANQAIGLARLGAEVAMIGRVGKDHFGSELLSSLRAGGVNSTGVKNTESAETGAASIMLAEGDNSIIVVPGANAHCTPADIEAQIELIERADIVLMQLEIPLATVTYAAKVAKQLEKTVILNPAPAQRLPPELLACVDYMTPNETELAILSEGQTGLEERMDAILTLGVHHVITTLGAQGVAYKEKGKTLLRIPGHQVPVVDTTGAGDAFNVGLAYAIGSGQVLPDAISFANKVAAVSVGRFGAQQGMPTLEEVVHFSESC